MTQKLQNPPLIHGGLPLLQVVIERNLDTWGQKMASNDSSIETVSVIQFSSPLCDVADGCLVQLDGFQRLTLVELRANLIDWPRRGAARPWKALALHSHTARIARITFILSQRNKNESIFL